MANKTKETDHWGELYHRITLHTNANMYKASCVCGWESVWSNAQAEAEAEGDGHVVAINV
jgi:hypothetical protein